MATNHVFHYVISGFVYGLSWGGGESSYPSKELRGSNREELIAKANKMLEDGSLDSGMGYQKLLGAVLLVDTYDVVKLDSKSYVNTDTDKVFIGNLNKNQKMHLSKVSGY